MVFVNQKKGLRFPRQLTAEVFSFRQWLTAEVFLDGFIIRQLIAERHFCLLHAFLSEIKCVSSNFQINLRLCPS